MSAMIVPGGGGIRIAALRNAHSFGIVAPGASAPFLTANYCLKLNLVLSGACVAGTLKTILSVSGRGALMSLGLMSMDATSRTHRVKITLDGVVVFDATSAAVTTATTIMLLGAPVVSGTSLVEVVSDPIIFDQSCLIEYASSLAETDKARFIHDYCLR